MANPNAPYGARIIGTSQSSAYTGKTMSFVTLSTDAAPLYQGDFVTLVENGAVNEFGLTLPAITRAAAGDVLVGIVNSVYRNADNLTLTYRAPNTVQTIVVNVDPYIMFSIQSAGTVALTDFGKNADIIVGSSPNVYQESSTSLSGTMASGTAQIRIIGLDPNPINSIGQYARLICIPNEHYFKQTTGV